MYNMVIVSVFKLILKIWIQWRKETLSNTHLDTIKLSKLQNKNKKKKNTRKAQTSSWNFVQRLYFLPPLEIFRELMEIVLGLINLFTFLHKISKRRKVIYSTLRVEKWLQG